MDIQSGLTNLIKKYLIMFAAMLVLWIRTRRFMSPEYWTFMIPRVTDIHSLIEIKLIAEPETIRI